MNPLIDLPKEIEDGIAALEGATVVLGAEFGSKTTYRVGGRCPVFITCTTICALEQVLDFVSRFPIYVLGNGSNTLVSDSGWPGIVLHLAGDFEEIRLENNSVRLGAGVSLPTAARQLASKGFSGLEWAVGVPGTVGGAVKMNAGGHGSETSHRLKSAEIFRFSEDGYRMQSLDVEELGLRYRGSNVKNQDVVAFGTFELERSDPEESKRIISEIVSWRREHQPGGQNAGSVFANPKDDSAARLIEIIGLKGFRLNGAQISTRHSNFIQSDPNGSSEDVFELIWLAQQRVERELGVRLRTEIRLVGFDEEKSRYLRGEDIPCPP